MEITMVKFEELSISATDLESVAEGQKAVDLVESQIHPSLRHRFRGSISPAGGVTWTWDPSRFRYDEGVLADAFARAVEAWESGTQLEPVDFSDEEKSKRAREEANLRWLVRQADAESARKSIRRGEQESVMDSPFHG